MIQVSGARRGGLGSGSCWQRYRLGEDGLRNALVVEGIVQTHVTKQKHESIAIKLM